MFDLMFEQIAPIRWILQDLIPEGTILLAGKPKSGKSWFALNTILSVILKQRFLKQEVVSCAGLYLALEDNKRRMKLRMALLMESYGDQLELLKASEYRCEWPGGGTGAALLDEYLEAHRAVKIVAVDVLKKIRPQTDGRRSAYETDYEAIEPWKKVADKYRVTLLLVHHTRKAEADDVFDEVSGTLGINGAVDQMIVLKRVIGSEKQATVHFRGRDLPEDHELGIELRDGWWELIGSAQQIAASDARRLILDVLAEADGPLKVVELLKLTGKKSRPSMTNFLTRMLKDGLITKDGNAYSLPNA